MKTEELAEDGADDDGDGVREPPRERCREGAVEDAAEDEVEEDDGRRKVPAELRALDDVPQACGAETIDIYMYWTTRRASSTNGNVVSCGTSQRRSGRVQTRRFTELRNTQWCVFSAVV